MTPVADGRERRDRPLSEPRPTRRRSARLRRRSRNATPLRRSRNATPPRRSRSATLLRTIAPPTIFVAACLLAWELWARRSSEPNPVVPAPSRIWHAFWTTRRVIPHHLATTLTETGIGIGIGVGAGLAIAVLISGWALARSVLQPLLVVSQTVPVQVMAPLLVLWFGFGLAPKVVVVALVVGFPVAVSTAAGLQGADAELLELLRTFGASRLQLLRMVLAPSALPGLFAGLRISLTYAVAGAVIGESVGATSGLGLYIARSQRSYRYDQVFAGIAIVVALSIALFSCVWALSRLGCPWLHVADRDGDGPGTPLAAPLRPTPASSAADQAAPTRHDLGLAPPNDAAPSAPIPSTEEVHR